jgi:anti-sigma-K factor RskA
MAHSDWHPDQAMLLEAIDGELPPDAAQAVSDHLLGCALCRQEFASLQQTLHHASHLLHDAYQQQLPPSAASRREFRERLAALDRRSASSAWWRRRTPWRLAALAAASAAAVALILFFYPERTLHTVSARDVLDRAQSVSALEASQVALPAVRQKFRIRIGAQEMTRTIYRDRRGHKQWELWDGAHLPARMAPAAAEELRLRLAGSPIDWSDPLSADSFTRWYLRHADKQRDVVTEETDLVSVQATAVSGPVVYATLRLRTADYHPISESLSFEDRQSVEISELEYEVLRDERALAQFSAPQSPQSPPPLDKKSDSLDAELQARSILHEIGADLGGEIQVRHSDGRAVEISGFVGTARQKTQLQAALAHIPGIVTRLTTLDDIPTRESRTQGIAKGEGGAGLSLGDALSDRMPDSIEREESASQALDLSQIILSQAFALNRLSERYTPEEESRLSDAGRATLRRIAADHADVVTRTAGNLLQHISTGFGTPAMSTLSVVMAGPWQNRSAALVTAAQRLDSGLTAFFSQTSDSATVAQRKSAIPPEIANLLTMAVELQKELAPLGPPAQ